MPEITNGHVSFNKMIITLQKISHSDLIHFVHVDKTIVHSVCNIKSLRLCGQCTQS